jgi:predicted 3-demethylubiquinone-9 3-methyltransferase (glyoxalase superfamily)
MNEITPCLWFDTEGEEAANLYTSVFPNSKILDIARYGSAGPRPEGRSFRLPCPSCSAIRTRRRRSASRQRC